MILLFHHHRRLSLFSERRPRTMVLHFSLTWASVEASSKDDRFSSLSSSRNSLLQVVFGLPGFLFPVKGFQVKAWLVKSSCPFLRVCPNHLHFLCFIVSLMSDISLRSKSSAFVILFGQKILWILLRHLLTYVCSLETTAVFRNQVSAPYSKTERTFVLKSLYLVFIRFYLKWLTLI